MFENRVLRRYLDLRGDGVTWAWGRLHDKELYDLYSSPNIWVIKSNRMRYVACMGQQQKCIQVFGGVNLPETTLKS